MKHCKEMLLYKRCELSPHLYDCNVGAFTQKYLCDFWLHQFHCRPITAGS